MLLNIDHEGEGKTKNNCQKLKAKANVGLETHFQQKWANESLSSFEIVDFANFAILKVFNQLEGATS